VQRLRYAGKRGNLHMLSIRMRTSTWYKSFVALALVFTFAVSALSPALAETAGQRSTRNIILGALAVTAGVIIYNNIHHKQVAHNTIVGRTADGGTVYADGRIVYPNGTVVYTSNNGRTPCAYDNEAEQCGANARGYPWRYAGTNRWYGRERERQGQQHGQHGEGDNGNHGGDGGDNG